MSNKQKKLKSVNKILLRYFLLLSILIIVFVEVICFIIVVNTTKKSAEDKVISVAREVTLIVDDEKQVNEAISRCRRDGIIVHILSTGGEVLLPTYESTWDGDIAEVNQRLKDAAINSPVVYSHDNAIHYLSKLNYRGESYLIISCSFSVFRSSLGFLLSYFIIVGVAVLLLSSLAAYSASQRLTMGIKNLSSTAEHFSQGDFNVEFTNAEYEELAVLSDTLNSVRDEVKKSGDFQRELLANVSHDLKTPLTMIKAYASMISEISGDDPEKRDKHLKIIIDEADRLTGLVNDVLTVSKVSSNIDELNLKVFNLTEFLYGIINKFKYLQETQGYTFMIDIDANLYTRADEEKIGQVIYNLLSNAINYTGDDKTIYISLKRDVIKDRVKLVVKDTGKGIAKDDLPEIWNRYYRVKETHNRPVKGTGLGLNIVKIILENHAFDFGVQSEIGKGSSFWVDFPSIPEKIEE